MDLKTIFKVVSEGVAENSSYTDKFALAMVSSVNGVILARYDEPSKTMSVRVMTDRPFGGIINEMESILGVDINQNASGTYNGIEIGSDAGTYADEYADTEHSVTGNPDLTKIVFSYVDPREHEQKSYGVEGIDISAETPEKYTSGL